MKSALDVHRTLLAKDVPHQIVRLRARLTSADDLPRVLGVQDGCLAVRCYTVERSTGPSFAAVLVPAGTVPVPAGLLKALDALSVLPARAEQVNAVTDYAAGLVSPVCLPGEVELLADVTLEAESVCYCAAGEGGLALAIDARDLLVATGARVAALPHPSAATVPDPRNATAPAGAATVLRLDRPARVRPVG